MRIGFIHPDLGIGGAERLVVDAALGLQKLGHAVDIYTSHHDPNHCFEETRDGTLNVHNIPPPFPRFFKGKFHILFAHARQLHLTLHLLSSSSTPPHDIYFVDQLSTCIPFLRAFTKRRVVFYCHFPDKLLADGEFVDGKATKRKGGLLKRLYRLPMDLLEELTTRQADVVLANSHFTARVFKSHFPTIRRTPKVIYPGINISAYETVPDKANPDITIVLSDRPTFLSLNRFENKKNIGLAIDAFAKFKTQVSAQRSSRNSDNMRMVLAGGYDPRLEDNVKTLVSLVDNVKSHGLTYHIITPAISRVNIPPINTNTVNSDVLFLLNFTTSQRSALLTAKSTIALLYTPTNEHFGIGPVEGMICGIPVLACNTGGPTETIVDTPPFERTGWLCPPDAQVWVDALNEIVGMSQTDRDALADRSQARARTYFGMEAMARGMEDALKEANSMGAVTGFTSVTGFTLATLLFLIFAFLIHQLKII